MSPSPSFGSSSFGSIAFGSDPLFSTKSIIDAVLRQTGHSQPTAEVNRRQVVLDAINARYSRIIGTRHWRWLYQELGINFDAPYSEGTMNVTHSSEIITGNATAWSVNAVPNNYLIPGNKSERYRITSVASSTSLSVEGEWSGDTASDLGYKIIKPILRLPSDCDHVRSLVIDGVGKLVPIGIQEMAQRTGTAPYLVGAPRYYTEMGPMGADGVNHIQVFPAPDQVYHGSLNYGLKVNKLLDEEGTFPLVPDRYRVILFYGALAEFYRFLKDPTNQATAENDYKSALFAMQNDTQFTDSSLVFQPQRNYRKRGRRMRYAMDRHDFGREE